VVDGKRPVSAYELVATVVIWVPSLKILYPVTPTLSVDADQERLIWDEETASAVRLVGVEGAWVSGEGGGAVDVRVNFIQLTSTWLVSKKSLRV
jgi:hypothetical protein